MKFCKTRSMSALDMPLKLQGFSKKGVFLRFNKKNCQFMHSSNHRGSFIKYCLANLIKLFELRIENSV